MTYDFSLVQTVDGFSQRIIVGIADTADRSINTILNQFIALSNRQVLTTPIAVVD